MKIVSNVTHKISSTVFSKSAEEKAFMLECDISCIANWYFGSDYMDIKKKNLWPLLMGGGELPQS